MRAPAEHATPMGCHQGVSADARCAVLWVPGAVTSRHTVFVAIPVTPALDATCGKLTGQAAIAPVMSRIGMRTMHDRDGVPLAYCAAGGS
jgi:hypothetical protein